MSSVSQSSFHLPTAKEPIAKPSNILHKGQTLTNMMLLFKCAHAQHLHFLLSEIAPVAATNILFSQTSKVNAVELDYMVTQTFENTTYDAVLTTVNFNANLLFIRGVSILHCVSLDFTILKRYTLSNLLNVGSSYILVGRNVIYFLFKNFGCVSFEANSPSFVSKSTPVVLRSKRPTG